MKPGRKQGARPKKGVRPGKVVANFGKWGRQSKFAGAAAKMAGAIGTGYMIVYLKTGRPYSLGVSLAGLGGAAVGAGISIRARNKALRKVIGRPALALRLAMETKNGTFQSAYLLILALGNIPKTERARLMKRILGRGATGFNAILKRLVGEFTAKAGERYANAFNLLEQEFKKSKLDVGNKGMLAIALFAGFAAPHFREEQRMERELPFKFEFRTTQGEKPVRVVLEDTHDGMRVVTSGLVQRK